jgi:hypothetical protein
MPGGTTRSGGSRSTLASQIIAADQKTEREFDVQRLTVMGGIEVVKKDPLGAPGSIVQATSGFSFAGARLYIRSRACQIFSGRDCILSWRDSSPTWRLVTGVRGGTYDFLVDGIADLIPSGTVKASSQANALENEFRWAQNIAWQSSLPHAIAPMRAFALNPTLIGIDPADPLITAGIALPAWPAWRSLPFSQKAPDSVIRPVTNFAQGSAFVSPRKILTFSKAANSQAPSFDATVTGLFPIGPESVGNLRFMLAGASTWYRNYELNTGPLIRGPALNTTKLFYFIHEGMIDDETSSIIPGRTLAFGPVPAGNGADFGVTSFSAVDRAAFGPNITIEGSVPADWWSQILTSGLGYAHFGVFIGQTDADDADLDEGTSFAIGTLTSISDTKAEGAVNCGMVGQTAFAAERGFTDESQLL